jgi:arginase family enzyme
MKDISIYFQPIEAQEAKSESLGSLIQKHTEGNFPDLKSNGIAIFYCPEFRNGEVSLHQKSEDRFRNDLWDLFPGLSWAFEIYDLGTILPGENINDTYFAITAVVSELVKAKIIPVMIGGTQDLTFPLYQAYQQLEQTVNLVAIDSKFDLGTPETPISKDGYLSQILMHRPCFLFNHSTIGIQLPFVKQTEVDLFEKLYFDACRLGEYNANYKVAEPLIRNSDIMSLDLQSIRNSDFKGDYYNSPNGFYADQICQIVRYAGISDKLTSFGIFNLLPGNITSSSFQLVAQIIWYFLDGISQRKGDFPIGSKKDYLKFIVHMESYENDLVFYKSHKSDRWWMEVPYPLKSGVKFERHHMVPCNHEDYQMAMQNEMPDLWWKTFQKLS